MSLNLRAFTVAQVAYIVVVATALLLLPGASFAPTLLAMVGVWCIVAICYNATTARNNAGWWALLSATALLSVGVIANIHYFTVAQGTTTEAPVLYNIDADHNFRSALFLLGIGAPEHEPGTLGYPLFISLIWRITGVTIVAPIVVNMLMTLLTAVVSGALAVRVLSAERINHSAQWIQSCAIIMTLAICYLLSTGAILLKDAGICLSMALIAYGLTIFNRPPATAKGRQSLWGAFILGIIGLATFRLRSLALIVIAIAVIIPWRHCTWALIRRAAIMLASIAVIWTAFAIVLNIAWDSYQLSLGLSVIESHFPGIFTSGEHPQHLYHDNLFSDYYSSPTWYRLIWLPLNTAVMYLIPFPWDFSRYLEFGYTAVYAKIAYPWYAIGGLALFYGIFCWRKSAAPLKWMFASAVILWLIPTYLTAGSVSRYVLPLATWLIPAAVLVWDKYRRTKNFKIYSAAYCTCLAAALIICHHLQSSAM